MKKLLSLALSLMFVFGAVACSRKTNDTTGTNTTDNATDDGYYNIYTGLYNTNIGTLGAYDMYSDVDSVEQSYRGKEYPGNRQYLADVKAAYKDSKEKIQAFIDGLKNDAKTDNAELKKMNEDLIAEGEKLIDDIDAKMKRLEQITEDDYNKSESDFIKLVDDTGRAGETVTNKFRDLLKDMDKRLGIDRTTIENNNTENTTK